MEDNLGDLFGADAAGATSPRRRPAPLREASYVRQSRAVVRAEASGAPGSLPRYTVSEFVSLVDRILRREIPGRVILTGEVSSLTRASSGHCYFSVKDQRSSFGCVAFRGAVPEEELPRVGDMVELEGEISTYGPRGSVQLKVLAVRPAGEGALYAAFLRLKAALQKEGLFDAARKRPVPRIPRTVGVVTSLRTAALRDVIKTLGRRAPYARIIVYPTPVQGAEASARIVAALGQAGRHGAADVLLLVRGGGSFEDLNCFNSEAVARAIAACPLPVISGVGHESDTTIADLAADVRAETPTAAAERCAADVSELRQAAEGAGALLARAMERFLLTQQQRVDLADRSLVSPGERLGAETGKVRALQAALMRFPRELRTRGEAAVREGARRLKAAAAGRLPTEESRLLRARGALLVVSPREKLGAEAGKVRALQAALMRFPRELRTRGETAVREGARRLKAVRPDTARAGHEAGLRAQRLGHAAGMLLQARWRGLERVEARFLSLDFQKTLERGFAVVVKEGRRLASVKGLAPGDRVRVTLADGEADMQVLSVAPARKQGRR